jgi:DNA polymerase-3 subunit epsilon
MKSDDARTVIVLDFETTGLSPHAGDRSIEVGAVKIEHGVVMDRFQSLMNPGFRISGFIEEYTGISNDMLSGAPRCSKVMKELKSFVGAMPLVAHNSSFDRRFLEAEWDRIGIACSNEFACSMLTARRVFPGAPNHRLDTLVAYSKIEPAGTFHRALADAEMTARLWLRMLEEVETAYNIDALPFSVVQRLSRVPKHAVPTFFSRLKRRFA